MSSEELLARGQLDAALAELKQQIRKDAANPKLRVFLFQLLAVDGDWDRAQTQLQICGDLDPLALAMVQTYREAMLCEALRAEIFAGKRTPMIFGDPQQWLALLVEALQCDARGDYAGATALREQAFDAAPTTAGDIDGTAFEWIADADTRLGPVLEAIVNGRYYWVPFQRIATLRIEPPEDLRDAVWMPVNFTWTNGGETVGLVPTRYPGSQASADPLVRLARRTEWNEPFPGVYHGAGQRLLATDAGDFPLMDARLVQFDATPQAAAHDG